MRRLRQLWLFVLAWSLLAWWDLAQLLLRRPGLATRAITASAETEPRLDVERELCEAMLLATCFYIKPVMCLQHSVCTGRLLRWHGVPATVTIGYRLNPFMAHAWVEVNGRVVNDSPVYKTRLNILHRA